MNGYGSEIDASPPFCWETVGHKHGRMLHRKIMWRDQCSATWSHPLYRLSTASQRKIYQSEKRKVIGRTTMIPNIPENPRNRKRPKRGRKRLFNASPVASFPASTHCSLGSRGGPEQRTRLVPSDKCAASWGSEDAEMRMITARFIRVLLRYTDSLCTHYMFTLQQVMPLSKPCNRL